MIEASNFIEEFINEDLAEGKVGTVHTRFPPEPNGYLHIGHCKALVIDFGTAKKYGGLCNLRMDDTNPAKEDTEYVDAIKEDIHWLGFDWGDRFFYGSDYFEKDYEYAVELIKKGLAYVCELTADQMDRLLTKLEQNFDFGNLAELTIEAGRPDTIDEEKLRVLRAHNTTRVSINPQTMEDNVLAAIGRRHTADDIRRAMEQVRAANFPHVNMDLIAGLPEDTPEGFARSLDEVISMGADNITVHTLSLKKGSRIMLEGSRIPGADEVAQMLDYADPTLRKHGFAPYYLYRQKYMSGSFENVGWTKPSGTGLYNIYIMEELHSILSLGAGGSTKMVGGGQIRRAFNAKYPREYIDRPEKRRANLMDFARFYAEQGE